MHLTPTKTQFYHGSIGQPNSRMFSSSFAPFPRLPLELKRQIWEDALPSGVYIEYYSEINRAAIQPTIARFKPVKTANRPRCHTIARCSMHAVPPMLHVSAEARAIALQHFHLLGTGSSRIYFNPEVDTLMLSALFWLDVAALCHCPVTSLGPNVVLVRHIVYNQAASNRLGLCIFPDFIKTFSGALESVTFLDFTEWERVFCLADYGEEMRAALANKIFRPEELVVLERRQLPRVYASFWRSLLFVWRGISQRPLDVRVMRLPVPAWKLEEVTKRQERKEQRSTEGCCGVYRFWMRLLFRLGFAPRDRERVDWYDGESYCGKNH